MTPHVLYIAPFAQRTGYAQAAHDYMLAMHRAGISLEIQPVTECSTEDLEERYQELLPLVRGWEGHESKKPTHVIVHTVPAHAHRFVGDLPSDVFRIALTTWETNELPSEIAASLDDAFDLVITPSEFCANAMIALGSKLRIFPHCFDPSHWPLADHPPNDMPYSFYSILGWSERKNPIGLLKAYLATFSACDEVILNLKASSPSIDDIAALISATGIPRSELPALNLVTEYFDHEDMVDFHHSNHCFVTAARGEGWNLPAFEAALAGRPVITPGWGGQMEYLYHYCNALPVSWQGTPAITPPQMGQLIAGTSIRSVNRIQPSGITARQWWAEPDLRALGNVMRTCYERRALVDVSNRSDFEMLYGYDTIGNNFAELLETHARI